ncbi:MAG: hypothetical protein ACLSWI_07035 [Candidatus Gastranaerophilaceae bacterium]
MPMLLADINERKYTSARLKTLKTIGEAVKNITLAEGIGNAENAEDFVENYLKKQIIIAKTCKNNDLRSCGIETTSNAITTLSDSKTKITMPTKIGDLFAGIASSVVTDVNLTSYGFVMGNGYSVNLFYNKNCLSDKKEQHQGADRVCVNAIYDMNGVARPNEVGKDIGFVTVIYPDEHVVSYAPYVDKRITSGTFDNTAKSCENLDKDLFVPNRDEVLSIYYNGRLLGITSGESWSSSEATAELGWYQRLGNGNRILADKSVVRPVMCIKR